MSIYQEMILDHYRYPRNQGKLADPTSVIDVSNPLCGDKLHFEVREKDGVLEQITFTGEGCAISIASASMLTEYAKGKPTEKLSAMDKNFVLELLKIELTPNRLKCALLSWEALMKVLHK